jgi:hypothetical protein
MRYGAKVKVTEDDLRKLFDIPKHVQIRKIDAKEKAEDEIDNIFYIHVDTFDKAFGFSQRPIGNMAEQISLEKLVRKVSEWRKKVREE